MSDAPQLAQAGGPTNFAQAVSDCQGQGRPLTRCAPSGRLSQSRWPCAVRRRGFYQQYFGAHHGQSGAIRGPTGYRFKSPLRVARADMEVKRSARVRDIDRRHLLPHPTSRFGSHVAIAGKSSKNPSKAIPKIKYGTTALKIWAVVTSGGATPRMVIRSR